MHARENALKAWLSKTLGSPAFHLTPLSGDASFRRYFRMHYQGQTRVVMDAPIDKESILPFVRIATLLEQHGILSPKLHALDTEQGFILLDDLGDTLLLSALCAETVDRLYEKALATLRMLQTCPTDTATVTLPAFDSAHMLQELTLFKDWFLEAYLGLSLSLQEQAWLASTLEGIVSAVADQPQVFMHRDYHSRNLMINADDDLVVIDFQDAMRGPLTYDLVSLLKDCYIAWPKATVHHWVNQFYKASPLASKKSSSVDDFIKDFDYCGLQRHLRILGVFSRLYLRDNKPGYLNDLPLTLHYVLETTASYPALHPLHAFLQEKVHLSCTPP